MPKPAFWKNNKRYYDLKSYWRNLYGCNVHKLPIDAGFSCPNRDGSIAYGGCIYCDGRGSKLRQKGELPTVAEQIQNGKKFYKPHASKFIAYFQTFTNTYAPVEKLQTLYDEALAEENVIGLSIGTRPDCVGPDVIGLPGESDKDVLQTASSIAALPINGIKIHSLLALEGTALGEMYKNESIKLITKEKYLSLVADVLELLPPEMVIQRLTADGYRDIFLAPDWAMNKLDVLNAINKELERRDSYQGKH